MANVLYGCSACGLRWGACHSYPRRPSLSLLLCSAALLAVGACAAPDSGASDVVFDPCSAPRAVGERQVSGERLLSMGDAAAMWNVLAASQLTLDTTGPGPQIPIRFEDAAGNFHGIYEGSVGEVYINTALTDRHERAVTSPTSSATLSGCPTWPRGERISVMNPEISTSSPPRRTSRPGRALGRLPGGAHPAIPSALAYLHAHDSGNNAVATDGDWHGRCFMTGGGAIMKLIGMAIVGALLATAAVAPAQAEEPQLLTSWGMAVSAGGGVNDFINDDAQEMTGVGGSWDARLVVGTRKYVAFEAAYLGSAQSIDALGLETDARLVGNGAEGVVRVNAMTGALQPYVFAGRRTSTTT